MSFVCSVCVHTVLHTTFCYVCTDISKMLESLDPGCDGKLSVSKLTRDEIPQENYVNLMEFIDILDANNDGKTVEISQEPEDISKEEWADDESGVNKESNRKSEKSGEEEDIEVL